ncbi:MAG: shikimate kinase [Saccharofermentanales bacterium]
MNRHYLKARLDKEFNLRLKSKLGKRLNRRLTSGETPKRFGLVGYPLGHTLSPYIHKQIMYSSGINGVYRSYEVKPDDFIDTAGRLIADLDGFNITIPYKQEIIPQLESLSGDAAKFGAVNTVSSNKGYNTDITGFRACGVPLKDKRVMLLGAGGAARVLLCEALEQGAAAVGVYARNPVQAQALVGRFSALFQETEMFCELIAGNAAAVNDQGGASDGPSPSHRTSPLPYDVILNATPVGMWPHCEGIPLSRAIIAEAEYVFDTIYNPLATRLVLAARSMNVKAQSGLGMLLHQAVAAQKIWNPCSDMSGFSFLTLEQMLRRRLLKKYPVKIVLTGFMGSGKTTVGRSLSKSLGIGFADIDLMIVEENAKPIPTIFREDGEAFFRRSEQHCIQKAMDMPKSMVIATGGGAVINPENVGIIRNNRGFIVFLHTDTKTIFERIGDDGGRPLLNGKSRQNIADLYEQRLPQYYAAADFTLEADGEVTDIVCRIRAAFGF